MNTWSAADTTELVRQATSAGAPVFQAEPIPPPVFDSPGEFASDELREIAIDALRAAGRATDTRLEMRLFLEAADALAELRNRARRQLDAVDQAVKPLRSGSIASLASA